MRGEVSLHPRVAIGPFPSAASEVADAGGWISHADEAGAGMEVVDFYVPRCRCAAMILLANEKTYCYMGLNQPQPTGRRSSAHSSRNPCIGIKVIDFSTGIKGILISLDIISLSINIPSSSVIYQM